MLETLKNTKSRYKSITTDEKKLWSDILEALNIGDYNSAITFLEQYISLYPEYLDAYINMGYAYINIKKYVEAKKYLEYALSIAESNNKDIDAVVYLNYAYALAGIGDNTIKFSTNKAKEYYRKALNYLEKYSKKERYNLNANALKKNIEDILNER